MTADWLDLLRDTTEHACAEGDIEELARLHCDLTEWLRGLRDIARDVEERLAEVAPEKRIELPDLPVMEVRRGAKRTKWQSDELLNRVVRIALDPDGTGELPASPLQAVEDVVTLIKDTMPVTPSLGWRVTALRKLGLDADEWCVTEPGRVSVQIYQAAETAA